MGATQTVAVEARLVAIVRKTVAMKDLREAQQSARATLSAALEAANVRPLPRSLTIWRMPRDGMMDYAPGLFVPEPFAVSGAVSLFTLPAGRAAHLVLRGPYDGLPSAWQTLFADCATLGLEPAGLNWEVYAAGDVPTEEIETDLYAMLA